MVTDAHLPLPMTDPRGLVPVYPEVLTQMRFAPMPWETHPIDTVIQSQGWGPFRGPWTPLDFADPAAKISRLWTDNPEDSTPDYGPGYNELSLFADPSLGRVNNNSVLASLQRAQSDSKVSTNTISQGPKWGMNRLMSALGIGSGDSG